jgi:hypothetical protein
MVRLAQALSRLVLPLGAAVLWGGLFEAERHFPGEFDWRYMTVSRLLSERDNPPGYGWGIVAIEGCGIAILLWTLLVSYVSSRTDAATQPAPGLRVLRWGGVCTMGSGLVPLRLASLPKLHEMLTLVAFICLCFGVVRTVHDRARRFVVRQAWGTWRARLVNGVVSGLLGAPIALAGLAQAYIFYLRPDLHWVGLEWRARHIPIYLSFAFWEWLTFALLTLYLVACSGPQPVTGARANT